MVRAETLYELIDSAAHRYSENSAIEFGEGKSLKKYRYKDLPILLDHAEEFFQQYEIAPGSKVCVIMQNSADMALLFLLIIASGRIFVPLNPKTGITDVGNILKDTLPDMVICNKKWNSSLQKTLSSYSLDTKFWNDSDAETWVECIQKLDAKNSKSKPNYSGRIAPDQVAQIVFTSGSTGRPKGVMITHANILSNSYELAKLFCIDDNDRMLTVCPLYHNSGQIFTTITPLFCGATNVVIRTDIGMLTFWDQVEKKCITWSLVMNAFLNVLLRKPPSNEYNQLKGILAGGSRLPEKTISNFENAYPTRVYQCYGLTETTSISSVERPDQKRAVGSTGKPLACCEIKVIYDNFKPHSSLDNGEILIRGENIANGYFNNPEATLARFLKDGWLRTGDIGYIDKENNLHVVERIDNMIIVGGENIYPAEIEGLVDNLDMMDDLLISSRPHQITDNEIVAIFSPSEGYQEEHHKQFASQWNKVISDKIGAFKTPKIYISINSIGLHTFPRAANGKIDRSAIISAWRSDSAMTTTQAGAVDIDENKIHSNDHSVRNPDLELYKNSVRKWIEHNSASLSKNDNTDPDKRFWSGQSTHKELYHAGLVGIHFPEKYGGKNKSQTFNTALYEVFSEFGLSVISNWVGYELVAETLLKFGSEQQKTLYIPEILNGSHVWAQCFSESKAGSDLASIEVSATRIGNNYSIYGEKMWSSWAHYADFILVLARTGPNKHKDLSLFICPTDTASLTIEPIRMIDGEHEENRVFFDNVILPEKSMLGGVGDGWKILMHNVDLARGAGAVPRILNLLTLMNAVRASLKDIPDIERWRLTGIDNQIAEAHALKSLIKNQNNLDYSNMPLASIGKWMWADIYQRFTESVVEIFNSECFKTDHAVEGALWPGQLLKEYYRAKGASIEGGTNEIQKNLIARQLFGKV